MSDYVVYWKQDSVAQLGPDEPINTPGSNQFRMLQPGDQVWVVALDDDGLYLVARIGVKEVLYAEEAKRRFDDLWPADWYVEATHDSRVASRRIPFEETATDLEFMGSKKSIDGEPSWIHFWSLREVTPASAEMLDSLWGGHESGKADVERQTASD